MLAWWLEVRRVQETERRKWCCFGNGKVALRPSSMLSDCPKVSVVLGLGVGKRVRGEETEANLESRCELLCLLKHKGDWNYGYVVQIFETTAMVLLEKCGELEATRTINLRRESLILFLTRGPAGNRYVCILGSFTRPSSPGSTKQEAAPSDFHGAASRTSLQSARSSGSCLACLPNEESTSVLDLPIWTSALTRSIHRGGAILSPMAPIRR